MTRLRWALARRLVGPVIADPIPGADGCAVVIREGGAMAIFTPTKFRIRSRLHRCTAQTSTGPLVTRRSRTTFAGILTR